MRYDGAQRPIAKLLALGPGARRSAESACLKADRIHELAGRADWNRKHAFNMTASAGTTLNAGDAAPLHHYRACR
jgi:hypothetical protein